MLNTLTIKKNLLFLIFEWWTYGARFFYILFYYISWIIFSALFDNASERSYKSCVKINKVLKIGVYIEDDLYINPVTNHESSYVYQHYQL